MKRSVLALIGSLAGFLYLSCLIYALARTPNPRMLTFIALGREVRVAYILPHLTLAALSNLLGWIAFAAKKRGCALASAIFYLAAAPLLPALFAVPLSLSLVLLAAFLVACARDAGRGQEAEDNLAAEDASEAEEPESPAAEASDDTARKPDDSSDRYAPGADGMGLFLGVFAFLAALTLIAIVFAGLTGVKLPFIPF